MSWPPSIKGTPLPVVSRGSGGCDSWVKENRDAACIVPGSASPARTHRRPRAHERQDGAVVRTPLFPPFTYPSATRTALGRGDHGNEPDMRMLKIGLMLDGVYSDKYVHELALWGKSQTNINISHLVLHPPNGNSLPAQLRDLFLKPAKII